MTTIAADTREGVMCSDGFWTDDDEKGCAKKIWRIRGDLYGLAGDLDCIALWLAAQRKNKPLPRREVTVLKLSKEGLQTWDKANGWLKVGQTQFAIGSGSKVARGAMAAGAKCARAVRIACDIDAGTSGPIRTYRLGA